VNAEPNMRPWRYNGPAPDGWFCQSGVDCLVDPANPYQSTSPQSMIDREMALAAQLGVATIRIEFDWPLIETANGVYDWSRADYIVNEANKYGLQLQPVLTYTPQWASGSLSNSTNWYEVPPASDQYWTDFVTHIVSRYKNSVHYWELWNEPDGGTYWYSNVNPGAQDFVTHILNPGYKAVKAVDPSAKVIVGPDHADTAWYSTIVADGGGNSFDIAAFHDYSNTALSGVQSMQSWLNSQGMGSKPIWIGEYGYAETTNTTSDTNHQSLMTTVLQGSGYQQAQWYTLRDELPRSCCPISGAEAKYFGVIQHDDVTLKNGFSTMQSLIASASGAPTATPLPSPVATRTPTPGALPTQTPTATVQPSATPRARGSVAAVKVERASSHLDFGLRRASLHRVKVRQKVKLTTYVSMKTVPGPLLLQESLRVTRNGKQVFHKHMVRRLNTGSRHQFAFWAFFTPRQLGNYAFTGSITPTTSRKHLMTRFTVVAQRGQ
jgi:putative glycosyl hydrolase